MKDFFSQTGFRLLPAAMLVVATGCGSGGQLELGRVQGTVTYQGKPLEQGRVVFSPEKGTVGPQSVGTINADGSFEMRTGEERGAPLASTWSPSTAAGSPRPSKSTT